MTKFIALILALASNPIECFGRIPENWRKVVLCTDSATAPEIVPGIDQLPESDPRAPLKFFSIPRMAADYYGSELKTMWLFGSPLIAIIYAPAILYRLSLKSTAFVWSPLVWAFRPIRQREDPKVFARGILQLSTYKFARFYSVVVVLLFLVKITIFFLWLRIQPSFQTLPGWPVIDAYFASTSIPLWHLTAVMSAILTWLIYFRAENYLHRAVDHPNLHDTTIVPFFKTTFVIRNVLAIYTAVCAIYITVRVAGSIEVPPLRLIVFPW